MCKQNLFRFVSGSVTQVSECRRTSTLFTSLQMLVTFIYTSFPYILHVPSLTGLGAGNLSSYWNLSCLHFEFPLYLVRPFLLKSLCHSLFTKSFFLFVRLSGSRTPSPPPHSLDQWEKFTKCIREIRRPSIRNSRGKQS